MQCRHAVKNAEVAASAVAAGGKSWKWALFFYCWQLRLHLSETAR